MREKHDIAHPNKTKRQSNTTKKQSNISIMTQKQQDEIIEMLNDKDVSEILSLLMQTGNAYSRRILRFFHWFCKWVPALIMLFHAYGMWDFGHNPREMFEPHEGNEACYAFIYFMLYILPMVIILASRFFFLCWRYRVPFFYYFGVNAIHVAYWSWYTTNAMVMPHYCLMLMVLCFYLYGWADDFVNKTRLGRLLFSSPLKNKNKTVQQGSEDNDEAPNENTTTNINSKQDETQNF